jgi:hypothetical protein
MYHFGKIDKEKVAILDAEIEKHGRKAIIFSLLALCLSLIDNRESKLSLLGVSINLENQFMINGVMCGFAITFGMLVAFYGILMIGEGTPSTFSRLNKRILIFLRNRVFSKNYRPIAAKRMTRTISFIIQTAFVGIFLFYVYLYYLGIKATSGDLVKLIEKSILL